MLLYPSGNKLGVEHPQIVQYEKYFLFAVFHQTGHEINQLFRVHAVLIQQKVVLSITVDTISQKIYKPANIYYSTYSLR